MWINNILLNCSVRTPGCVAASLASYKNPVFLFARKLTGSAPSRQFSAIARFTTVKKIFPHSSASKPALTRCFCVSKSRWSDVLNTNVAKDVILYKFDNRKMFHVATLFGAVNCLMFLSLTANLYTITKLQWEKSTEGTSPSEFDPESAAPTQPEIYNPRDNVGVYSLLDVSSDTWRMVLAGVCFFMAYAVLGASYVYCNQSVSFIVLRKGGKQVTLVTHGFFARNRFYTHDVEQISCRGNRTISSAVLLRAKDKYFSYILDKKGEYTNPRLFDATVGVLRDLKK